jgi:hypothetical protein
MGNNSVKNKKTRIQLWVKKINRRQPSKTRAKRKPWIKIMDRETTL